MVIKKMVVIFIFNNVIFYIFQEEKSPYPILKLTGGEDILHAEEVQIVADGFNLITDDGSCDCTLGIAVLMATYWVYGFEYPKSLKKNICFFGTLCFQFDKHQNSTCPCLAAAHRP